MGKAAPKHRPTSVVPLGAILANAFDPKQPLASRSRSHVQAVLRGLRERSGTFRQQLAGAGRIDVSSPAINDAEVYVLDTLASVGIHPRYRNSTRPEALAAWLRSLV